MLAAVVSFTLMALAVMFAETGGEAERRCLSPSLSDHDWRKVQSSLRTFAFILGILALLSARYL